MNVRVNQDQIEEKHNIHPKTGVHCLVRPLTGNVKETLADEGMIITQLPFRVGRASDSPLINNDLAFKDQKPYQVSRHHFSIDRTDKHVIVRDRGSFLGTWVNDQKIGGHSDHNSAVLHLGKNEIVLGAPESPFRLEVEVIAQES